MPRVRILSQSQGVFVGPAPSTGFHFLNKFGDPTGDADAINLVKQINGVTQLDYRININRTDIDELGRRETVKRAIITHPDVDVNFTYYTSDLKNEIRMGFSPNFHTGMSYTDSVWDNNTGVFALSGFLSRESYPAYSGVSGDPTNGDDAGHIGFNSNWPYADRDKRNIFVGIAPEGADLKDIPNREYDEMHCIAFGDCHLSQYETQFAINEQIKTSVSYKCDNVMFNMSGSGLSPAMATKTFTPVNDNIFIVPKLKGELSGVHTSGTAQPLRAADINLRITATGYGPESKDIKDVGVNFRDLSIQSAAVAIEINRKKWMGLGHKLPVDRPVHYPIRVKATFNALVGEQQSGNLYNFITKDYPYDLIFECRPPSINCSGYDQKDVMLRYDVLSANLDSLSFSNTVNEGMKVELAFTADVADRAFRQGIFMSGMVFASGLPWSGYNF
tara:strand:+ start:586 stop:1923 length:1338 start_codon:yes stop_codon:yes gene_type:complete